MNINMIKNKDSHMKINRNYFKIFCNLIKVVKKERVRRNNKENL